MQGSRPLVSYDDLALPYGPDGPSDFAGPSDASNAPPPKKRKAGNGGTTKPARKAVSQTTETDESRELTHEEIWDDSALIEAWNAATEEYEALNGPDKGWKSEPVHRSPFIMSPDRWYNIPQKINDNKTVDSSSSVPAKGTADAENDSQPLDFNTFVPAYNPALELPGPLEFDDSPQPATHSSSSRGRHAFFINQDEAFRRASDAMYWAGYWTAMYHCQKYYGSQLHRQDRQATSQVGPDDDEGGEEYYEDEEADVDGDEVMVDFTPTQR
ncbi:hypothetical protein AX16_000567 [Volvariella volvacea WC 439]|nr:hypothetical protein AX16_000567 [Volvariella volvacea WC 439]